MQIEGKKALVTGANRGLGKHLAGQLRDKGATVYAGARDPDAIAIEGVTPIRIDLTDSASIAAAAAKVGDLSILLNNAGSSTGSSLLTGSLDDIRSELEVNYLGTLEVTRAFAPQLAEQDESSILNILSVLSWISFPAAAAYCAAKAAEWSMTNALRQELIGQGTRVIGLHVAYMDTDMARDVDAPKSDPAEIAALALEAIEAGTFEVIADDTTRKVLGGLSAGVAGLYPELDGK
jgi:NAD(P)-dependent dehydrogenase (short-subunit alcohol dehydrogenase family)